MGNFSDTGPGTCRCQIVWLLELVLRTHFGKMGLKCQDLRGLSSSLTSLPMVSALLEQPETDEGPRFHMLHSLQFTLVASIPLQDLPSLGIEGI